MSKKRKTQPSSGGTKSKTRKTGLGFRLVGGIRETHKPSAKLYGIRFNRLAARLDNPRALFATVGLNRASVYECLPNGQTKLLQAYVDGKADEDFFTCDWTVNVTTQDYLLAVAGKLGIIHLLNVSKFSDSGVLLGHGGDINEIQFHPTEYQLLLSASTDLTIRLWNVRTKVCVTVFHGDHGHRDQVLSIAIHAGGTRFASSSMDHSIKVWSLDLPAVQENLKRAEEATPQSLAEKSFPTNVVQVPISSTSAVHHNYVDCVRWLGDLIFSKATENYISCWSFGGRERLDLSEKQSTDLGDPVTIVHRFRLSFCKIWFIRAAVSFECKLLANGNETGKIQVWDLSNNWTTEPNDVLEEPKSTSSFRQIDMIAMPWGQVLAGVTDDSMIWRWDRSFHIKQEPDAASEKAGEAAASAASPAAATTLKTDGAAASATRKDGTG